MQYRLHSYENPQQKTHSRLMATALLMTFIKCCYDILHRKWAGDFSFCTKGRQKANKAPFYDQFSVAIQIRNIIIYYIYKPSI